MKTNKMIFLTMLFLVRLSGYGQLKGPDGFYRAGFTDLQIAYSKTTSLIFPYPIKTIDKGSEGVLIQKARGVENILLVKAAEHDFAQTNLTVVTTDGKLYGFVLNYDEQCPDLNLIADNSIVVHRDIQFSLENENKKEIEQYARLALYKNQQKIDLRKESSKITLELTGLFIHQEVVYFRLVLGNDSNVSFDMDQLRFFICDQRRSTRTAVQEIEISPLLITSDPLRIPDNSKVAIVAALPKFTVPKKKILTIQLVERNAQRQVAINMNSRDFLGLDILNIL